MTPLDSLDCLDLVNVPRLLSISEQLVIHLRDEILRGAISGLIPGSKKLAGIYEVNHKTVQSALIRLEEWGYLKSQGKGRPRKVTIPKDAAPRALRVGLLLYEPEDERVHFVLDLQNTLSAAGHLPVIASKSLTEMGMDPKKVARYIRDHPADAWIVQAGSREVLEFFAGLKTPAFALFGNLGDLPLPRIAPDTGTAIVEAVRSLIHLGHRRIVMLSNEERILPSPGFSEKLFLAELEENGISTSAYNLPVFESSPEGLTKMLDALFRVTPPQP